jgi:hypothetical protein
MAFTSMLSHNIGKFNNKKNKLLVLYLILTMYIIYFLKYDFIVDLCGNMSVLQICEKNRHTL